MCIRDSLVPVGLFFRAEFGGSGNAAERVAVGEVQRTDRGFRTGLWLVVAKRLSQQLLAGALLWRQFVFKQKAIFPVC